MIGFTSMSATPLQAYPVSEDMAFPALPHSEIHSMPRAWRYDHPINVHVPQNTSTAHDLCRRIKRYHSGAPTLTRSESLRLYPGLARRILLRVLPSTLRLPPFLQEFHPVTLCADLQQSAQLDQPVLQKFLPSCGASLCRAILRSQRPR